jgi:hypothetical protein
MTILIRMLVLGAAFLFIVVSAGMMQRSFLRWVGRRLRQEYWALSVWRVMLQRWHCLWF